MKEKLQMCKICDQEIAKKAEVCPHCGAKNRKPFFKRWWFWLLCLILTALVLYVIFGINQNRITLPLSQQEKDSTTVESTYILEAQEETEAEVTVPSATVEVTPTEETAPYIHFPFCLSWRREDSFPSASINSPLIFRAWSNSGCKHFFYFETV